jgi:hypothetical protein
VRHGASGSTAALDAGGALRQLWTQSVGAEPVPSSGPAPAYGAALADGRGLVGAVGLGNGVGDASGGSVAIGPLPAG